MSLHIQDLVLQRADGVPLLGPVSLDLHPGERLALVGESGSGKSLLVQALFGVLPEGVRQASGTLAAFGHRLDLANPAAEPPWGSRLAWVPQRPDQALNPLLTLGEQLALLPGLHRRESARAALDRLRPLLQRLGLPCDPGFLARFPHQVSGGQRQRLTLAMALSCAPELLVLDEPTTALDGAAARAFRDLILALQREQGLGFLWITHDLTLASQACERLVVLYGGHVLEAGPSEQLLASPRHPYTGRLVAAARLAPGADSGFLPAPEDRPPGCPFQPRCESRSEACPIWRPWRGEAGAGLRCEHPLEPAPTP